MSDLSCSKVNDSTEKERESVPCIPHVVGTKCPYMYSNTSKRPYGDVFWLHLLISNKFHVVSTYFF